MYGIDHRPQQVEQNAATAGRVEAAAGKAGGKSNAIVLRCYNVYFDDVRYVCASVNRSSALLAIGWK